MTAPQPELVLRQARIAGREDSLLDIAIAGGRIVEIAPRVAASAREERLEGRIVLPGFVESHIHLDKSCLLDRCNGSGDLKASIGAVAAAKRNFTVEDVYARGRKTLEKSILQGTTRMRTHVEVDPRVGLRGFEAVRRLKAEYAWAIDLQICVFPQEGLLNDPGTDELLVAAIEGGADVVGGCPYTDSDPAGQIARIFELAALYDLDIDFHADFHLDPARMDLGEICRQARLHHWEGRVTVGHVSSLSAMTAAQREPVAAMLRDSGVALTVLPSTDLFLMGRDCDHAVPRGVAPAHWFAERGVLCSLSTNNVLNPFTPFGDCSLLRMANLYANIAQLGSAEAIRGCFEMVTSQPARLLNLKNYGIAVDNPADIVVLDSTRADLAVAELSQPLFALKGGRRTFSRPAPVLYADDRSAARYASSISRL